MQTLKYLAGYSANIQDQVIKLIEADKLNDFLLKKYPLGHEVKTDKALYRYVMDLKSQYLKQSNPLSKVIYDDKIDLVHHALGLHTFVSRVQGNQLKSKNEIRIGAVFKKCPVDFLRMIVVHELAHLKEKDHNKAFYKLCDYMEPRYHQLEFDLRLYLTQLDLFGKPH